MSYFDADFEQTKESQKQLELAGCKAEPVIFNTSEYLNMAAFRAQRACSYERRGFLQEAVKSIDEVMRHMRRAREALMKDIADGQ